MYMFRLIFVWLLKSVRVIIGFFYFVFFRLIIETKACVCDINDATSRMRKFYILNMLEKTCLRRLAYKSTKSRNSHRSRNLHKKWPATLRASKRAKGWSGPEIQIDISLEMVPVALSVIPNVFWPTKPVRVVCVQRGRTWSSWYLWYSLWISTRSMVLTNSTNLCESFKVSFRFWIYFELS